MAKIVFSSKTWDRIDRTRDFISSIFYTIKELFIALDLLFLSGFFILHFFVVFFFIVGWGVLYNNMFIVEVFFYGFYEGVFTEEFVLLVSFSFVFFIIWSFLYKVIFVAFLNFIMVLRIKLRKILGIKKQLVSYSKYFHRLKFTLEKFILVLLSWFFETLVFALQKKFVLIKLRILTLPKVMLQKMYFNILSFKNLIYDWFLKSLKVKMKDRMVLNSKRHLGKKIVKALKQSSRKGVAKRSRKSTRKTGGVA